MMTFGSRDFQGRRRLASLRLPRDRVCAFFNNLEIFVVGRLGFQRFVGLRASSQIPDRTTIWTFKEHLIQAGASESIFEAVNRQLNKYGYIARGGQMIDASIVQAPKQSLSKEEKALVRENALLMEWKPAKRRQKDILRQFSPQT
jgi:IS5 family transposase